MHVPCRFGRWPGYRDKLTSLRDQLKLGLTGGIEHPEGAPTIGELAEQIKVLKASQTIESTQRSATRKVSAEEPVMARIKRKAEKAVDADDDESPDGMMHRERFANERRSVNCRA
jgi:hypothetical protein